MNLSSHSARSTTSSATPLPAATHEVDSSEDEQDREEEEEEAHIHVQEQKIPLMNTDTIQRVEKGEGSQKVYLFHLGYKYFRPDFHAPG